MDYIGQTELRKKQQKVRNKNYILETNGTFMTTMTPVNLFHILMED